jgi:hypothetical protein
MAPQNIKIKNSKNKRPNATKIDSQTPIKKFICCFVVRVQILFIELQVAPL